MAGVKNGGRIRHLFLYLSAGTDRCAEYFKWHLVWIGTYQAKNASIIPSLKFPNISMLNNEYGAKSTLNALLRPLTLQGFFVTVRHSHCVYDAQTLAESANCVMKDKAVPYLCEQLE